MVLRPGGLTDFTQKSKSLVLSMRSLTVHADTMVEIRIDFIPQGFFAKPISVYLQQNKGQLFGTTSASPKGSTYTLAPEFFKLDRVRGYFAENDHVE